MNVTEMAIGVVGLGLLLAGTYGLGRAVGVVVRRVELSEKRTKQFVVYSRFAAMLVGGGLGAALYLRYQFLVPILTAVGADGSWISWSIGQGIGMGLVALAGVYAGARGHGPTFRDVLEQRHTVPSRYRRRLWSAHALLVVGFPIAFLSLLFAETSAVVVSAAFVPVALGWIVLRSPVVSLAYRTRDPTAEERSRIERCFEQFDREAPKVVLFDDEREDLDVRLIGRGAVRTLWLQESLCSDATDDELAAVLAMEDEKNRRWFYERTLFAFCTGIFGITALGIALLELVGGAFSIEFLSGSPQSFAAWVGAGLVAFAALIASNWRARRVVSRADRFATSRFDPEVVRRMYDRYAETITAIDHEQISSDVQWKLVVEPPMPKRIRRIEREHDLEPMEAPATADRDDGDDNAARGVRDDQTGHGRTDRDAREGTVVRASDEWITDADSGVDRDSLERTLAAMEPAAFARLVADLRAEWGRQCSVIDAPDDPWIDVAATAEDGTRELLRTVHRSTATDDPVTSWEFTDGNGRIEYDGSADSVLVVTNGRFDDAARSRARDLASTPTLVDGDRLLDLLEETGLAARLEAEAPSADRTRPFSEP